MTRVPSVLIIWDYDSAIGQINSSFPYNYRERALFEEVENVDRLLAITSEAGLRMTFACVGFAAEPGTFPYHIPEQLCRIHAAGHEIASHSWRHEWFPFLEREQVRRSLARSKEALEACIGAPGAVRGFVPPFSRPMTWYRKGSISLGDRTLNPLRAAADLTSLCRALRDAGYAWCRVAYRSIAMRLRMSADRPLLAHPAERCAGIACIPQHHTGFDETANRHLERALSERKSVVLVAHPSMLSHGKAEGFERFEAMMKRLAQLRAEGRIIARTVSEHLADGGAVA